MERGLCDVREKGEWERLMHNLVNHIFYFRRNRPKFNAQSFLYVQTIQCKGKI